MAVARAAVVVASGAVVVTMVAVANAVVAVANTMAAVANTMVAAANTMVVAANTMAAVANTMAAHIMGRFMGMDITSIDTVMVAAGGMVAGMPGEALAGHGRPLVAGFGFAIDAAAARSYLVIALLLWLNQKRLRYAHSSSMETCADSLPHGKSNS